MKFKMRQKPTLPQRKMLRYRMEVWSGVSLQAFIDWCATYNIHPSDVKMERDHHDICYYFVLDVPEPDETYNLLLEQFNVRLEKYNRWAEENVTQIEEYKQNQADKKKADKKKDVAYLERQLEKDRKVLDKLKKSLET